MFGSNNFPYCLSGSRVYTMAGFKGIVVLVVVASLAGASPVRDDDELKAVVVLFRHGDRTPLSSWPNDEYFENATLFPEGNGQLINLGKERHFELGQWFRERYDGFLPKKYHYSKIYVQSTDVDRTLQSAASNLAGLFPPEEEQVWNKNLLWQPVPIHTIPESNDAILATTVPCDKHSSLRKELINSEEFQKLNDKLAPLFQNISELTGYSNVDITTFAELHSTIYIYREFNLTLKDWTDTYWEQISRMAALDFQLDTYTQDLARLKVGPFFDFLINHLKSLKTGALVPQRHIRGPKYQHLELKAAGNQPFLMLSAHDSTVSDRLNAMGVYDDAAPEFAATLIWELKNGSNGSYVNMYFKNSTHFSKLTLPGCTFDCGFDDYVKLLEPISVSLSQWTKECKN
ncbi:prostatic acid phosphatase-like isoform X1 [Euwallacea fornicatus]|uniref:prostatic acid phosphatase-like isoform X1 n=1 Tax=Euwallacea fornicatus TaxID=995702 RepID=UPI00338D7843